MFPVIKYSAVPCDRICIVIIIRFLLPLLLINYVHPMCYAEPN